MTFPVAEGQLPLFYNHEPAGRGDDYLNLTGQPLHPFGYGLSYTSFRYSALTIEPAETGPTDTAVVRLRVRNIWPRAGDEVVQLYVRDDLASIARPVLQLQGFRRAHQAPDEEREVIFVLGPEQLKLLDGDGRWVVEAGIFDVFVGASSKDPRLRGELVVRQRSRTFYMKPCRPWDTRTVVRPRDASNAAGQALAIRTADPKLRPVAQAKEPVTIR